MSIVLIGYRAVGKTTVGRLLAGALGWGFADCDELVAAQAGCPVRELIETRGEAVFREVEHQVLLSLAGRPRLVIATGGGIVLDPRHPALLRALGEVVWLTAGFETIVARVAGSDRPRLTSLPLRDEVARHLQERTALYEATAHRSFDTMGRTEEQVADGVRALLGQEGRLEEPAPTLEFIRERIDSIDRALVGLVSERLGCAMQAWAIKTAAGRAVVDPPREEHVVAAWLAAGRAAGLDERDLESVARALIASCRHAQQR